MREQRVTQAEEESQRLVATWCVRLGTSGALAIALALLALGIWPLASVSLLLAALNLLTPSLNRRLGFRMGMGILMAGDSILVFAAAALSGGVNSPFLSVLVILPLSQLMCIGTRPALLLLFAQVAGMLGLSALQYSGMTLSLLPHGQNLYWASAILLQTSAVIIALGVLLWRTHRLTMTSYGDVLRDVEHEEREAAKAKANLELTMEQAQNVLTRVRDGQLRARMSTEAASGASLELCQHVNDFMDAVEERSEGMMFRLGKLSERDLRVRWTEFETNDVSQGVRASFNDALCQLESFMESVVQSSDEAAQHTHAIAVTSKQQLSGAQNRLGTLDSLHTMLASTGEGSLELGHSATSAMRLTNESRIIVERCAVRLAHVSSAIREMSARAAAASQVVHTINSIARKSNLLALNAAIEAARAGDAGLGFAVIANQVRVLAADSAAAALKTSKVMQQTVASADLAVADGEELVRQFCSIQSTIARVDATIENVETRSKTLRDVLSRIEQDFAKLAATASEDVVASSDSLSTIGELETAMNALVFLTEDFTVSSSSASPYRGQSPPPQRKHLRPSTANASRFWSGNEIQTLQSTLPSENIRCFSDEKGQSR